jgi:hypothetical protein
LDCKVQLPPSPLLPQLPNSLPKGRADFTCHPHYRRTMLSV